MCIVCFAYVWEHECAYMHMESWCWELILKSLFHLIHWARVSHWIWNHQVTGQYAPVIGLSLPPSGNYRCMWLYQAFEWMLDLQTQVLVSVEQTFSWLSHHHNLGKRGREGRLRQPLFPASRAPRRLMRVSDTQKSHSTREAGNILPSWCSSHLLQQGRTCLSPCSGTVYTSQETASQYISAPNVPAPDTKLTSHKTFNVCDMAEERNSTNT